MPFPSIIYVQVENMFGSKYFGLVWIILDHNQNNLLMLLNQRPKNFGPAQIILDWHE